MRNQTCPVITKFFLHWIMVLVICVLTGCEENKRLGSHDPEVLASEAADDATKTASALNDAGNENGKTIKIIVSAQSTLEPMTYTRALTLQKFARQRAGLSITFLDALGESYQQIAQIKASLADHPKVILLFTEDAPALHEVIQQALKQGVKVIALGHDMTDLQVTTSIFTDEHKIGTLAGQFIVEALKKKAQDEGKLEAVGRIVEITGDASGGVSKARSEGVAQAIALAPGIHLVHQAPGNWNVKDTQARMTEALRLQKPFDIVFAHSDFMAKAAHETLKALSMEQREQMLVMGVDGFVGRSGGVQMVVRSELDATVFNPPLVDLAWKVVLKILENPSFVPAKHYELEPFIVNLEKAMDLSAKGMPTPSL